MFACMFDISPCRLSQSFQPETFFFCFSWQKNQDKSNLLAYKVILRKFGFQNANKHSEELQGIYYALFVVFRVFK